jgi:hypothetical protein
MHNILPNINYQPGFVINRVDALYVPVTDRFLCLFSIALIRKPSTKKYFVFTLFQITFSTHLKIHKTKLVNKILEIMHSKDLP